MRHFSLLKLLTFSSFTSTDSLLQVQLQPSGTRTTSASGSRGPNVAAATHFGRGHRLHKSIEAAAVSPQKSETHTSTNIDSANDNAKSISTSTSRRRALGSLVDGSIALLATGSLSKSAQALDMDSFINAQLESDTKNCDPKRDAKCIPKLSQDEALCKYGQSGDARGEACKRVKAAGGKLPQSNGPVKSLGGAYAM